jgi:hypothetical protein
MLARLLSMLIALALAACGDAATQTITVGERRAAIAALAVQIQAHYLDAGAGARVATLLRTRERTGAYDAIHTDAALAQRLSADLLQASHDTQLTVTLAAATPWWPRVRDDAGIASVDKIGADIGYLDIRTFLPPDRAAARYARTFGKLAAMRTIIVDLRQNRGGDADGLQLLASYLVDRPIHYADLRHRDGAVDARWAYPQLAARPYLEQLTILIGPGTAAEAENVAFAMQAWHRATVIGSRSAGVTASARSVPLTGRLVAAIPDARVTLPLLGTSWESGVIPDVATSGDALKTAKRAVLTDRFAHVTTPMGRSALLALLHQL